MDAMNEDRNQKNRDPWSLSGIPAEAPSSLSEIVQEVILLNPLQKKRIAKFLESQGPDYFRFAEELSTQILRLLNTKDKRVEGAKSYIKMCQDFLKEQIQFKKTGKYSVYLASEAEQSVYRDPEVMKYYMVGLLISYLFWRNHYEMFQFFAKNLPFDGRSYLEVGVGHGLFLATAMRNNPQIQPTVVDISETSIGVAKDFLDAFGVDQSKIQFINKDYLKLSFDSERQFDRIVMGEVLEHVNEPELFLQKTKSLLAPGGQVFISTCANAPAIDHVYHFHNCEEIRDLIRQAGFKILKDLALPSEDLPEKEWEKEMITINYCAILS